MGDYLNSTQVYSLYERETKKPYFVDKTAKLKGDTRRPGWSATYRRS
ncbi:MAG: hypothetical protein LUD12_17310 [Lachnospiraceae bacterium]|nr:hypothetical protein [Lachnospiraceae bacterium]